MQHEVYDLETYPNLFTVCFKPVGRNVMYSFEISHRRDQRNDIITHVNQIDRMIGFNNMGFDWPILKALLDTPSITPYQLYQMADVIIQSDDRFAQIDWTPRIEQLDLYRLHHFDNRTKLTSLKTLEFNMRMTNIRDLPFAPGTYIEPDQIDNVLIYNGHDVRATEQFYFKSLDKIRLRENMNRRWLNYSDTKIGTQFVIDRLEKAGVECYYHDANGRKKPRQTPRPDGVRLNDIVFPWLQFRELELELLHADVLEQTIVETRGAFNRTFDYHGVKVSFGLGGLHGAVKRRKYTSGRIIDIDVKSYYPEIIAKQKVFPEHLGPKFCEVIGEIVKERDTTTVGTDENKTLKLGGNSVFGQTNSDFGPFLDPACMLGITINGQLMALKLAEMVLDAPEIELIQINTDGMTVHIPDEYNAEPLIAELRDACSQWCEMTNMTLKIKEYKRLFIRDVNNYIGEFADGECVRKGAYEYDRDWHQNFSGLVVSKGAEAVLLRDEDPETFVMLHEDPWDFMFRVKINKNSTLVFDDGSQMGGTIRYYLSEDGQTATKRMPKTTTRLHASGFSEPEGKRGNWTCPECGFHSTRKADVKTHIEDCHASKLVVCQEYHGDAIPIDVRPYVAAITELTRDFT